MVVSFGQVVVGPPGSGKTTFCSGMQQYLSSMGRRAVVVNLDPANFGDQVPYKADIDILELVSLQAVMDEYDLGPNGGLVYCLEYLEKNMDWLIDKCDKLRNAPPGQQTPYFLFDLPGQVELFTHYHVVQRIVAALQKADHRLTAVHLVDAHHCSSPSLFISVVLLSLTTMLRLELPHVNVLSKVDLLARYGELAFNLDFFTDCLDIKQILRYLDAPPLTAYEEEEGWKEEEGEGGGEEGRGVGGRYDDGSDEEDSGEESGRSGRGVGRRRGQQQQQQESRLQRAFGKMNAELCDVIEDFGLVSFYPLHVEEAESVERVLAAVDKSNGFFLSEAASGVGSLAGGGVGGGGGGGGTSASTSSAAAPAAASSASSSAWRGSAAAAAVPYHLSDVTERG